jgi:hypothetical protein
MTWFGARLEDLDYGYIEGICSASRAYPLEGVKKAEVETALGYFESNAPACATTGFASAACSSAPASWKQAARPCLRLKQAGMHWTTGGAGAIMTLRCQQASRPEDQVWHDTRSQVKSAAS